MKTLALVMAGGEGSRLHPLTADRAKPAIAFAGGHRIWDFVLSNLVNSGITSIYVLAQYKPQSLIEHIRAAWAPALRERGASGSRLGARAFSVHGGRRAQESAPVRASSHAYASMGNYLFDPGVLAALLDEAARRGETDFGRHVLPRATSTHRVFAYDFAGNRVPGILPHEERNYWRDVGTIEAYRAAQRDASGPRPKFSLANEHWPIGSGLRGRVAERVAPRIES